MFPLELADLIAVRPRPQSLSVLRTDEALAALPAGVILLPSQHYRRPALVIAWRTQVGVETTITPPAVRLLTAG